MKYAYKIKYIDSKREQHRKTTNWHNSLRDAYKEAKEIVKDSIESSICATHKE